MTLGQKQRIYVLNVSKFIAFAYSQGFELSFGEFYRPPEMQKIYFETGRSKTMVGRHPDRLAGDFNVFYKGRMLFAPGQTKEQYKADLMIMKPLGEYWESLHPDNRWGGDWNRNDILDETFYDPYHVEMMN